MTDERLGRGIEGGGVGITTDGFERILAKLDTAGTEGDVLERALTACPSTPTRGRKMGRVF